MLNNLNKPYPFIDDLGFQLKVITGISLGMFLFVLFFQPVSIEGFEFNSKLMIIAGFGGIPFFILSFNQIVLPSIFPRLFLKGNWKLFKEIILQLITWAMIAVAYNFYSRFVGQVILNFDTSFRIILMGLFPMLALLAFNRFSYLKHRLVHVESIAEEAGVLMKRESMDAEITFDSENKSEEFTVNLSSIIFIRSANNYIEIVCSQGEQFQKQLIRSTLKNAEHILKSYGNIFRCHRTTIVNADYVSHLTGNPGNLKLRMTAGDEDLPVSRQYLMVVKQALKGQRDK